MLRRHFLKTSLAAVAAPSPQRPNIVLIMADDQGWGDTGYNGHPELKTPNLDMLAASGLRFNRFYTAHFNCSPTRGSIMTGKYPPRFGITNFIGGNRAGKLAPAPNARHLPCQYLT